MTKEVDGKHATKKSESRVGSAGRRSKASTRSSGKPSGKQQRPTAETHGDVAATVVAMAHRSAADIQAAIANADAYVAAYGPGKAPLPDVKAEEEQVEEAGRAEDAKLLVMRLRRCVLVHAFGAHACLFLRRDAHTHTHTHTLLCKMALRVLEANPAVESPGGVDGATVSPNFMKSPKLKLPNSLTTSAALRP